MSHTDSLRGPLGRPDRPMSHVVVELVAVVSVLGLLAALVYAPLLATLLLGGVAGAAIGLVLPRAGEHGPTASTDSDTDSISSRRGPSAAD